MRLDVQLKVLDTFARALRREAHHLTQQPDQLWQQLYNRLQWESDPLPAVLVPERARRTRVGATPWLHLHAPLPESRALIRTLTGHTSDVRACAWSPDGTLLLSGSDDRTLTLWDAATGQRIVSLLGHTRNVTTEGISACVFSPDGATIVSASSDYTPENLLLWDATSGQLRTRLRGHEGPVYTCTFSPDGATIASGGDDRTLRLWDAHTAQLRLTIPDEQRNPVHCCRWSPDGATLYSSASWDNIITAWDPHTGRRLGTLATGHTNYVRDFNLSRDGAMLLSCSADGTIKLWDTRTSHELATLAVPYVEVLAAQFSPDGTIIAAAYSDNMLRLWDAHSGQLRAILAAHTSHVYDCAFSPGGSQLLSASADQSLRLWDVSNALHGDQYTPALLTEHLDRIVSQCLWSPDGQSLLVRLWNTVELWDAQVSRVRLSLTGQRSGIHACSWSPDSILFVLGGDDTDYEAKADTAAENAASPATRSTVVLRDARTGQERAMPGSHAGQIGYCAFSPDGTSLVSASADSVVKLWDVATGSLRAQWHGGTLCAWSPDGRIVASSEYDNRDIPLILHDVRTGSEQTLALSRASVVHGRAFSPDGTTLLIVHERKLSLWDLATNQPRAVLAADDLAPIATRTFSPDGQLVASGFGRNLIGLWNAYNGQQAAILQGHTGKVTHCAFTPDGALLVSRGNDASLKVWDVRTGQVRASLPLPASWIGLGEAVVHPHQPAVALSSETHIYFVTLEAIAYGPLIVTAVDRGSGLTVRCPLCHQDLALIRSQLGSVITCTHLDCGAQMRINPFVIQVT